MVEIENVHFAYRDREALRGVSLRVTRGEVFGLLGPNGSGKTTLFRILATLLPPTSGRVVIDGIPLTPACRQAGLPSPRKRGEGWGEGIVPRDAPLQRVREKIGVVFQAPSLDTKLTVQENLTHQGHLYGLAGRRLKERSRQMLERLGLADRAGHLVERLSGGLKRRVEVAKGLLHRPELLILDEPSTGLDPGARLDLWRYLKQLSQEEGITVLLTTHLMEEAERCDRLAILNQGKLVSLGEPARLKREIGGDVIVVEAEDLEGLASKIEERFGVRSRIMNGSLLMEHERGTHFLLELAEAFPGAVRSITFRKPTLEDVFIHKTGHKFWDANDQ